MYRGGSRGLGSLKGRLRLAEANCRRRRARDHPRQPLHDTEVGSIIRPPTCTGPLGSGIPRMLDYQCRSLSRACDKDAVSSGRSDIDDDFQRLHIGSSAEHVLGLLDPIEREATGDEELGIDRLCLQELQQHRGRNRVDDRATGRKMTNSDRFAFLMPFSGRMEPLQDLY